MREGLRLFMPPEEIHRAVDDLADRIRDDFRERDPVLVGVLKGAFVFMADLVRSLAIPLEVDFIRASCYRGSTVPSEDVEIVRDITADVKDRPVVLVEGIVDRGVTAEAIIDHIMAKGARSVDVCALLLRDGHIRHHVEVKYAGRAIDEGFVVGYGMDIDERCRGLSGIYLLEEEEEKT